MALRTTPLPWHRFNGFNGFNGFNRFNRFNGFNGCSKGMHKCSGGNGSVFFRWCSGRARNGRTAQ